MVSEYHLAMKSRAAKKKINKLKKKKKNKEYHLGILLKSIHSVCSKT